MIVPIFRLVSLLCHSKAVTAAAAATPRWCSPGRAPVEAWSIHWFQ